MTLKISIRDRHAGAKAAAVLPNNPRSNAASHKSSQNSKATSSLNNNDGTTSSTSKTLVTITLSLTLMFKTEIVSFLFSI